LDDDLVETERVGTSNYYWSFPGKVFKKVKEKLKKIIFSVVKFDKEKGII
jgi:hypothetical protein